MTILKNVTKAGKAALAHLRSIGTMLGKQRKDDTCKLIRVILSVLFKGGPVYSIARWEVVSMLWGALRPRTKL